MKNFFSKYDIAHKLLAILLAIVLWAFVINSDKIERVNTYSGVPVVFQGAEELESTYGLKIIEGADQKMTIKVSGSFSDMSEYSKKSTIATVTVNLANLHITEPGTYSISSDQHCQLNIYDNRVSGTIDGPATFNIVVDHMVEKDVPVSIEVEGVPSADYLYGDATSDLETVAITGPETVVNTIRKAIGVVPEADSNNLTKTSNLLVSFTFLDEDGQEVDQTHLTCTPNDFYVTIPVYRLAKIPLTVDLINSETLTRDSVDVKIDPAEIAVYGSDELVSQLTEFKLGSINLGAVDLTEPKTLPITLPEGVNRATGEPATAKVTIKAAGMSSREITVTSIDLQNSGTDTSLHAALQTASITVRLQAEAGVLNTITPEDILVRASFNADELGPGTHSVPVEIQPYGIAHFTVLNPDQHVTIEITKSDGTADPPVEPPEAGTNGDGESDQEPTAEDQQPE